MSGGMAMFRSELRSAVREAQAGAAARPQPRPYTPAPAAQRPAAKRTTIRLWLPLTPLWIVLAPFALLLAPALAFVPQTRGLPPFRAAFAIGATLLALSGTVVDVTSPAALIRIRIL